MTAPEDIPPTPTPAPQGTVTELVSGIIGDMQKLARQQLDMLKAEIRDDMSRTKRAMVYGGLSVALLTVGGMALIFGLVYLLRDAGHLPEWGAWLLFAGLGTAGGLALGVVARNMFESFNPLPDKTFNALQENLTWQTQPQA